MTSSRGQNVSVLPRSDIESITVFTDAGGSLRSASRKISLKTDKTTFRNEKCFGQHSFKTLSANAYATFQKRDYSSTSKCSNPPVTASVKSSTLLNSINRELSPVRWCDREVDGVYLGRSGWVQVQQRSLDDCKNGLYSENTSFSTLPPRKNDSDLSPDCRFKERKECNRFLNLPLPTKKRIIRDDYESSSKFTQKLESASPPSITPIISPPPAFKDNGFGVEFSRQTVREPYVYRKSFPQRSEITAVSEIFPNSLLERRNDLNSSSSTIRTESVLPSPLKHQRSLNETSNGKYFEDGYSHKMWRNRCLDSTSRFRSLDDETRMTNEQELSVCDSFRRSFGNPGKETLSKKEEKNIETDEIDGNKHFLRLQSSSWEALNDQRFLSKTLSRLNHQDDNRRKFAEDSWNSYRTRSSSLDSNSSSSNDSSSSSSSSSSSRSSNYKNAEKTISRKIDLKQSQQPKFDNSLNRDCRHFNVKRSRSLQLSEKKSPSESTFLNNSLSENSWNPVLLESSTCRIKNQAKESFPQHFLNHVFVTVNGESIPVVASSNQSLKSLNKITRSAVEQKKLIMEAEKEARIISEFMNGTRSRAAARNLLMHRYLNQPEDDNSTALTGRNNPQKTEHDSRFLMSSQSPTNKQNCINKTYFDGGSSSKKSQIRPLASDLGQYSISNYSKPLTSVFSNSYQNESFTSFHNFPKQRKTEQVESKEKEKSRLVFSEQADGNLSKRKRQNMTFSLDRASLNSKTQKERPELFLSQKQKLNTLNRHNTEKVESEFMEKNLKNISKIAAKSLSAKTVLGTEKRNFGNNAFEEDSLTSSSSSSSSSSSDICLTDFSTKFKKTKKIMGSSAHYKDCTPDSNFRTLKEHFCARPGSAPESEGCSSKGIDKRSLSLPRSFLSERYGLHNSHQRNLLPSKQGHSKTPAETPEECRLNLQSSITAPTTPVRDLRYGKSTESLYQIPSYRSSCVSLFGETPIFMSRRIIQESAKEFERPAETSNEKNTFCFDKHSLNISGSSSETILRKFKKNFSLKYLKRKENVRENIGSVNNETESENVDNLCVTNSLNSSLQAFENDSGNVSEQPHGFFRKKSFEKRAFRNEKYDSLDSGIQMINRGILDSSESQDTDIQEDAYSPLVARRYEIRPKPKSEVFNHILIDKYKADLYRRIKIKKRDHGKVVKRSYSDLGDHRLLNRDVNKYGEGFNFYSSTLRDPNAKNTLRSPFPEVSVALSRSERLLKPRLRRSLSQPLGFYDLRPTERRKPSTLKGSAGREGEKNPRQRKSEDEFLSDSESSACSLHDRKKPREESTVLAEAVWDHVAIESDELPFRAGDVIEVLDTRNKDWWWGAAKESSGYFPSAFVRLRVSQEDTVEDCLAALARGKSFSKQLRRGKSVSFLSNDQVRSRIVRELLNTERDFVKILQDVKDGYLTQCKQRSDMFTSEQITTIFSNLEDLLAFQNKFLHDLEANIDKEFPFKSCIGEIFLNHGSSFRMYSEYCNSHPMAIATLQDLYKKYNYCKFFEMCRLKQRLIEIPLDGYLLTPVQRICKYPLQLGELLKYTKPDHPDYKNVQEALETMRSVATLINERKRKMESLEKLAAWQQRVEGWEGEDLIEVSSQLIHQGDVVKIASGMWTTNITLFLFDHQIIYCKKDLLKKNVYIYKGRISLDDSDIIDMPDGKCQQLGANIKYGLKINNKSKDKWLIFCCRSNEDKVKWLEALAEEKKLVALDKERNLDLPPTTKQLAKMAVQTNKYPPDKLKVKNKFAFNRDSLLCADNHSGVSKSKSSKRIGMWFHFGGMMKNTKTNLKPRASHHRFT